MMDKRPFTDLDWLDSSITHATRQQAVPKDAIETIIVALTAISRHLRGAGAVPPPQVNDEKNWPTFSLLLHGCKGCGEECHPIVVAGYWLCPACHSMDLVCIEQDPELLANVIDRVRPPTTDAEMQRLAGVAAPEEAR